MSADDLAARKFDTKLARELIPLAVNEPTGLQALSWRLAEACDEIDRLAARLLQPETLDESAKRTITAQHEFTEQLKAKLQEAEREAEDASVGWTRETALLTDSLAREAALKEALESVRDVVEGWTRRMDYEERNGVIQRIVSEVFAALAEKPGEAA